MKLGDLVTYAVVGACVVAGVAISIVVVLAKHEIDHPPELVPPHAEGEIVAKGPLLGDWTLHPDACVLAPITYVDTGIWFIERAHTDHGVGVTRDDHEIVLAVPGDENRRPTRFSRGMCSTWDVSIERGERLRLEIHGQSDETHFYWSGHLQFDCSKDGETAHGNIHFDHCLRP